MRSSSALLVAFAAALMLAPTILAQPTSEPVPAPDHPTPTPWPPTNSTAPANDQYWYATSIAAGQTITQDVSNATFSGWEQVSCGWSPNVWFRVYAPNATGIRVDMTGSEVTTTLGLYRWYPSYENTVGCASAANGTTVLDAAVIRGEYLIEVAAPHGLGNVTITVTMDGSLAPYELTAPYAYLSTDPVVDEPVTIHAAVQSLGKPIDVPFSVGFTFDGWWLGEVRVNATNSTWFYTSFTFVPPYAGNVTMAYAVDIYNELPEMLEGNNWRELPVEVLPTPDLQVTILDLRRVPLRTEAGDLRHPLALHEATIEVCNLGGGWIDSVVNLTIVSGGEYAGGSGAMSLGSFEEYPAPLSCGTRTIRFSTANAIGDFTVVAEGFSTRDHSPWNNDDRAYGYNLVAENGGIVVSVDGLLP